MGLFATYFNLTTLDWTLLALSALLVGFAKTGISGASTLAIPIMAAIFGGKSSAGIMLPLLCVGDLFGVWFYNRHANWRFIARLLPWAGVGLAAGLVVGDMINDRQFKTIIALIVGSGLALMLWQQSRKDKVQIPDAWWVGALLGLLGGFATMIGNAAGPIMALYLLSMRLPKMEFIGTGAWFFLIINFIKLPLNAFVWDTITPMTLTLNALFIPAIVTGAILGRYVVHIVPERSFRWLIVVSTFAASLKLVF